jgi:hypothetical protein
MDGKGGKNERETEKETNEGTAKEREEKMFALRLATNDHRKFVTLTTRTTV